MRWQVTPTQRSAPAWAKITVAKYFGGIASDLQTDCLNETNLQALWFSFDLYCFIDASLHWWGSGQALVRIVSCFPSIWSCAPTLGETRKETQEVPAPLWAGTSWVSFLVFQFGCEFKCAALLSSNIIRPSKNHRDEIEASRGKSGFDTAENEP